MSIGTTSSPTPGAEAATGSGWFLYGLVPGDVETTAGARGLGDPFGPVTVVSHGGVAALVSEMPLDTRLGRPEHLMAYKGLLDAAAVEVPVLPVRFGTVLASRAAVADLLAARHDEYLDLLDSVDGRVEYLVRARYVERELLAGVLAERPDAAALRDRLRGLPPDVGVDERIRLGEIVNRAVEQRRAADTDELVARLAPLSVTVAPQPPTHEQDAGNVAFLVERERRAEFAEAVDRLAAQWSPRATLRLLGPLAAYHFVTGTAERG